MSFDILKVLDGALKLPSVDGLGGLASVLERHTEVRTAGASRLGVLDIGGGVTDLKGEELAMDALVDVSDLSIIYHFDDVVGSLGDWGEGRNKVEKVGLLIGRWEWKSVRDAKTSNCSSFILAERQATVRGKCTCLP